MTTNGPGLTQTSLFTHHFTTLKDPRRITKGNFQYPLEEILFLTISGIVCGFNEWKEIIFFGESKLDWLRKFFPFKNGIPSHDILNNLFKSLKTNEFNECFIKWVNSIADNSEGRVIAFDGKTVCGNASNLGVSKLHIVSAFCAKNELSLGQIKVDDKSNELRSTSRRPKFK
jgi:hypothetical protein